MNLYSSAVICNSTKGLNLADFLHTRTLNCREKSDDFREASECNITSELYRVYIYIYIKTSGSELRPRKVELIYIYIYIYI